MGAPNGRMLRTAHRSGDEATVRFLADIGADCSFPALVRGEELPPVAMCPNMRMVAVLESISHSAVQPLLMAQRKSPNGFKHAVRLPATPVAPAVPARRRMAQRVSQSCICVERDVAGRPRW